MYFVNLNIVLKDLNLYVNCTKSFTEISVRYRIIGMQENGAEPFIYATEAIFEYGRKIA